MTKWMTFLIGLFAVWSLIGVILGVVGTCYIVVALTGGDLLRYEHQINWLMPSSILLLISSSVFGQVLNYRLNTEASKD